MSDTTKPDTNDTIYDAVIIGSGVAGFTSAITIGKLGGRAVLVEKKKLGGVCVNYGCIPTKAMIAGVKLIDKLRKPDRMERMGVSILGYEAHFEKLMQWKDHVVNVSSLGVRQLISENHVEYIEGEARIIAPGKVKVGEKLLEAKKIIIATGSSSLSLPEVPIDGKSILASRHVLELDHIPKDFVIIGGGFIGAEFAGVFNLLGSRVTVIEFLPRLLPNEDEEISEAFTREYQKRGITVLADHKVIGREAQTLIIKNMKDSGIQKIPFEKALMAVGRVPNLPPELDSLGIHYSKKGIIVNEYLETNVPGIYAAGDVTELSLLAHLGIYQAEIAASNVMDTPRKACYEYVSSCV
ncbi:dihydrolipoyl dehydrogenase, partial [Candidatus Woesearchaeota archaeon CG_4_10_14_0_8_um_filter_47_5]